MHTIGERLEEARKRQSLSIREAAEATKIRADYLLNMESNLFNFQLPEIYRRGFLRVYATYLKLDADKLLTDYHALHLGNTRARSRRGYGAPVVDAAEETPAVDAVPAPVDGEMPDEADDAAQAAPVDPHQYLKIGGVIAGIIVLIIALIAGTNALFSGGETPEPNPELAQAAPVSTINHCVFSAKDDITSLTVTCDGQKLFSGAVRKGERIPVSFEGHAELLCTQTQYLTIELNGKTYTLGATGVSRATFPPKTAPAL